MEGSVDFFVNMDEGFYFDMYMNAEQMFQLIEQEIKKIPDAKKRDLLMML